MSDERKLKEAIQHMAGTHLWDKVQLVDCNVDSVDINNGVCSATSIGGNAQTKFPNVSLESDIADGLLIVPKVGSTITIIYSTRNDAFVFKYSDIDNIFYYGKKWQFGDGSFGGIMKVPALVLNLNIQLNALIAAITAGYTAQAGIDGGVGLTAFSSAVGSVQDLKTADLENNNVTHGL